VKTDKPWRPDDYPAPRPHIVRPDEPLSDPDLSDEDVERLDKILVIIFAAGIVALVILATVIYITHLPGGGSPQ